MDLGQRTIGLIVLPGHPLRVAWHAAYDNLVFHARFHDGQTAADVVRNFVGLDGALCPAFLPGVEPGLPPFVFADSLGFHTIGMAADDDPEPKATAAILSRALEPRQNEDISPTVGKRSAAILAEEVVKYWNCHDGVDLLHLHSLRAGDGASVARALGQVREHIGEHPVEEGARTDAPQGDIRFSLQFFPSRQRRSVSAQFLAQAKENRRSGAGVLPEQDRWMLDAASHPSGLSLPQLRWARRDEELQPRHAKLAIAFDTFESSVALADSDVKERPFHAFGLLSLYDRRYAPNPSPEWTSTNLPGSEGEKHPSRRSHTEILARLHAELQHSVSRHLGDDNSLWKKSRLSTFHRCDDALR